MQKAIRMIACLAVGFALHADKAVKVDAAIPPYKKAPGISGNLNSVGSDSLNNLMTFWVEAFNKEYPAVKIQVEGKGSGTAPPALVEGTSHLGPMSREMKKEEIDKFEARHKVKPVKVAVALDTLGVFVNKKNPLTKLTVKELDGIFSKTRKSGAGEIRTWGELGLKAEFAPKPISLYGRNSASGTYGYFKEHALEKGDFKDTVKEQPGSSSVVQSVGTDKFAIGYSGIGYRTSDVKALALSSDGKQFFEPTYENALNGKYPLARYLYIYFNPKSGDPLVREFLKFVLSRKGQEIVVKDGYYPLPKKVIDQNLALLK
ncbi:PstS family phosphate ABC transporter substrate-binding protein [Mesoterricola sediminis]|uniref:Phosphate-binding protein n=1 Tax=Mesoterricola sediminis TaxID=2927980 RepID=A0AA48GWI7_9BACT|nr:phosphate ABC transporter substrate-binding protein [Mesoterricola sediminis]BDU76960.1 phosphate-binding protein [Mesoterricola sediminis]